MKNRDIQGLRGLAVIAVVFNHLFGNAIPGGYLGVDVFFVISGYVITSSSMKNLDSTFLAFISGFYRRRVNRILPALSVTVVVGSILSALFINPLSLNYFTSGVTGLFALASLSNGFLIAVNSNYFSNSSELNVFTHTWSLAVEMQFYLFFPIIFYVINKSIKKTVFKAFVRIACVAAFGASFMSFIYLSTVSHAYMYYSPISRAWEFGLGVLVAILPREIRKSTGHAFLRYLLLTSLCLCFFIPVNHELIATISSVFFASASLYCARQSVENNTILSNKFMFWIGERSYSIYLIHWVLISILRWTFGISVITALLFFVVLAGCSELMYRYIENSSVLKKGIQLFRLNVWPGFASSIGAVTLSFLVLFTFRGALFVGTHDATFNKTKSIFSTGCDTSDLAQNGVNILDVCSTGLASGKRKFFLVGDSHAKQFEDPLKGKVNADGFQFVSAWSSGCIFPTTPLSPERCIAGGKNLEKQLLERSVRGDVVVIANQLLNYLSSDESTNSGSNKSLDVVYRDRLDEYFLGFGTLVNGLSNKGVRIIVYNDGVQFPGLQVGALCSKEWFRQRLPENCYRNLSNYLAVREPIDSYLNDLEKRGQIEVWDGINYSTCEQDLCVAQNMSDSNHFIDWYTWEIVGLRFKNSNF
jgi:peptidoglycan/LPS O-acetylase OafA/YrhL